MRTSNRLSHKEYESLSLEYELNPPRLSGKPGFISNMRETKLANELLSPEYARIINMNAKITVVGSINNDLIINSPKQPRMGETVMGSGFITAPGGKGANQAVAAARLGADTAMIGAIGGDLFGADLKATLGHNNINTQYVKTHKHTPTGTAIIILHQGDNFIVLDSGANKELSPSYIDEAEPVIKTADMLIVQLEIPHETAAHAMKIAKKHGVKVLLNPAPANNVPDSLIQLADILTPNETECESLSGINPQKKPEEAVNFFREKGVEQVCITLGEHGAVYNVGDSIVHTPCRKVDNVVDTTAAGDAFTAGLAVALCEGRGIEEAVAFASVAASITVTKKGAQPSLPYRRDVEYSRRTPKPG